MMNQVNQKTTLEFNATERQSMAWRALDSQEDGDVLYGGAKGGGKSHLGCVWCYTRCKQIIEHCQIRQRPKFPIPVGWMGRKVGKDFRETTLDTWKRVIPASMYEIKGNPAEIIIDGKVVIYTGGLDRQETINKFNSAEFHFAFVDQAEETTQDDISVLRGAMRQKINGFHLPYKILYTANPAPCWLKAEFIDNPPERNTFVKALPADNPYLPESYMATLEAAFGYRPELLKAYRDGDWNLIDTPTQIILGRYIQAAKKIRFFPTEPRRYLAIDTARYGDDETVILEMEETLIRNHTIMPHCASTQISHAAARLSREVEDTNRYGGKVFVIVEATGGDIGAAVADELRDLGVEVIEYCPQGKATDDKKYYNQRAEAWWTVAQKFSRGEVSIDGDYSDREFQQRLESQLMTPTYKFRGERVLVESKEDIKERLGSSPDRADAYVLALYKLDSIPTPRGGAREKHDYWGADDMNAHIAEMAA